MKKDLDAYDTKSLVEMNEAYLHWMEITNYSESTIQVRRVYLSYFLQWCEERGLNSPQEITRQIVERYQRFLFHFRKKRDGKPLSNKSQHSRLVPIRAFFKWMTKRNITLYNPAADIELPRAEQRLPMHTLTASDVESVMCLPDISNPVGLCHRAILETFYSTGIRRSSLIKLAIYDIDFTRGTVMLRQAKNRKDAVIPIGERALAWIEKYMFESREKLQVDLNDQTLFLTGKGAPYSPNSMTALVRDYINRADVGKKGSCHLFRHTMSTLMLENGADVRYIQSMLSHAKLETTAIYTQVSIRKLKEIHSLTHPGARLESEKAQEVAEELEDEIGQAPQA